jgi:hypothetical protein
VQHELATGSTAVVGDDACSPGGSVPDSLASVGELMAFDCNAVPTVTRGKSLPRVCAATVRYPQALG